MKKNVLKSVVLLICLLGVVLLTSCEVYTDNNEYRADITIINRTDSHTYIDIREEYESSPPAVADHIRDIEIAGNSSTNVEFKWIPGDFGVVIIDGAGEDDASFSLLFEAHDAGNVKLTESDIYFRMKGNQTRSVVVTVIPVKENYYDDEFNEKFLSKITDPVDRDAFLDLFHGQIVEHQGNETLYWYLSSLPVYTAGLEADNYINKKILPIFKMYGIPTENHTYIYSLVE